MTRPAVTLAGTVRKDKRAWTEGRVLRAGKRFVDVELSDGSVLRHLALSGTARTGETVQLSYEKGKYTAHGAGASGGGGGSSASAPESFLSWGTPSPHDLNSTHHQGTLADVQAPQFLKVDGSRALTGNWGVSVGVTIDGVDISVFKAAYDAFVAGIVETAQDAVGAALYNTGHDVLLTYDDANNRISADVDKDDAFTWKAAHIFNTAVVTANAGVTVSGAAITANAGVVVAAGQSLTTPAIISTAGLSIAPTNDITLNPAGKYTSPFANYDINLGSIGKKYLTLHAAELWVETLVAQSTLATIGGRILVGPTNILAADLTPAATTISVKYNNFDSGDRVYMEAGGSVEFMAITSAASGAGPYSYTVTRNLDGSGANQWYAGDAMFNTGTTNDGHMDIYSVRGVKSASHHGPTIVGNVRMSATYNDWIEHWAMGHLSGLYGYGDGAYGLAAGKFDDTSTWISVDSTYGLRINRGATSPIKLGQWDMSGNVTIGQVDAGKSNVYITGGALKLRNNEDSVITLLSTANAAGQIATFDGVIGVTANGGIWQGSVGTFAAPDTGFKLYQSGSKGVWESWYNGVKQVYIDPVDMSLHAPGFVASGSSALLVSRFDGPHPYNTNFSGDATGHLGQVAAVGGGVIYRPGKYGKALQAAEVTTNLVTNPRINGVTTGYSQRGTPSTFGATTEQAHIGTYSLKIGTDVTGQGVYYIDDTLLAASTQYTFSISMRGLVGGEQVRLGFFDSVGGHQWGSTITLTTEWTRHTFTATFSTGTTRRVEIESVAAPQTWYCDTFQVEQKAYATPYCDGAMGTGHTWSGTAHASSSSRTAGTVTYPSTAIPSSGTISVWVNTTALMSANENYRWIADGGYTSGIVLYITSGDVLGLYVGGSLRCSYTLTDSNFPPETWHHVAATWSPTGGCKLYLNGTQVGSTGANASPADDGGGWDIGRAGANYWWPGWIDDFVLLNTVMSATDVKRTYESNVPFYIGTSAWGFSTANGNITANERGLYLKTISNLAALGVSSVDGEPWGGATLDQGDVLIGRTNANYMLFDNSTGMTTFNGRIESTSGEIAGWLIQPSGISNGNFAMVSNVQGDGYLQILSAADYIQLIHLSVGGLAMRVGSTSTPPQIQWRDSLPSGTLRGQLAQWVAGGDNFNLKLQTFNASNSYAQTMLDVTDSSGVWGIRQSHWIDERTSPGNTKARWSLIAYETGNIYEMIRAEYNNADDSREISMISRTKFDNVVMMRNGTTGGGATFWSGQVTSGTAVTVIADGAGDVRYRARVEYVVWDSAGNSVSGVGDYANNTDNTVTTTSGNDVNIRINANGSMDVRRTAGSLTFDVTLWVLHY